MHNRYFASCALIILLTAPLGCLYETAEKPYIVEVELKDDSIHKPPPSAGKMLAGKKFKKAKLKGEKFMGAMLAGADLRQADLEDADLQDAMLMGANMSGANLTNANFEGAMLLGAQLEEALIDGANFKNTAFLDQDQLDGACGKPRALPETLKAPTGVNCKPTTIDSK
jgi:Pentapeptide repeats (8 copies)